MSDTMNDLNAAAADWLRKKKELDQNLQESGLVATTQYTPSDRLRDKLDKELSFRKWPVPADVRQAFLDWVKWTREGRLPCDDTDLWLIELVEEAFPS